MFRIVKLLLVSLLVFFSSGCALMAFTGLTGKIPVDERIQECEHGVKDHEEVRDMKKQRHTLKFSCFPEPKSWTLESKLHDEVK